VAKGDPVVRRVTVVFGPSRSKRFKKAVAEAQSGAGECLELEPGRYEVRFVLGHKADAYAGLARLLEQVRHWRATEVYEDEEKVSTFHAKEMGWCADSQLRLFGECRFHFYYGVFPRCSLCPLFDAERAIRDVLGENLHPGAMFNIEISRAIQARLRGEPPSGFDPDVDVPDFLPEEWGGAPPPRPDAEEDDDER
jgi:hypothetical protein